MTMSPRRPESKNWTGLPEEFRTRAKSVFEQNFKDEAEKGVFMIDGRIYPREILLRVGFRPHGRLKQTNFEVSMDHSPDQRAMEKLFIGIDALGAVFETHFEHENEGETDEVDYPLMWQEFDFEETPLHLRFSTTNTDLEAEADRLLGLSDESLYQDEVILDVEDALDRAEVDSELAEELSSKMRSGEYAPQLTEEQMLNINQNHGHTHGTHSDPFRRGVKDADADKLH